MKVSDLRIGAKVVLGSCYGSDIVWCKVSDNCDFISQRRVCRICFDGAEHRSDSRARRSHGNGFYPDSNIHQWLNAAGLDWYRKSHEFDESPYYRNEPGFLTEFSSAERDALVPMELTVAVPLGSRKKYGRTFNMSALVTLPSASQCGYGETEILCEGSELPEISNVLNGWNATLTRTGVKDGGHVVRSGSGWVDIICADDSSDIYPFIRINPETVINDTPDMDGVYWTNLADTESAEAFLSFISN